MQRSLCLSGELTGEVQTPGHVNCDLSQSPFEWKHKGTKAPPPEALTPHLQMLLGDFFPKALFLSGQLPSSILQEGDHGEQFPEIRTECMAALPVPQVLADLLESWGPEGQGEFTAKPRCQRSESKPRPHSASVASVCVYLKFCFWW